MIIVRLSPHFGNALTPYTVRVRRGAALARERGDTEGALQFSLLKEQSRDSFDAPATRGTEGPESSSFAELLDTMECQGLACLAATLTAGARLDAFLAESYAGATFAGQGDGAPRLDASFVQRLSSLERMLQRYTAGEDEDGKKRLHAAFERTLRVRLGASPPLPPVLSGHAASLTPY